jgi:hypothetical protein
MYKVWGLLMFLLISTTHTKRPGLNPTPPAQKSSPPIITIIEKEPVLDFLEEEKPPTLYEKGLSIYHNPGASWWWLVYSGVEKTRNIWRVGTDPLAMSAQWKDHTTREWPWMKMLMALTLPAIVVGGGFLIWFYGAPYYSGRLVSRHQRVK